MGSLKRVSKFNPAAHLAACSEHLNDVYYLCGYILL